MESGGDLPKTDHLPGRAKVFAPRAILSYSGSIAPAVPRWSALPDHPLAEAITLRDVIRKLMENQKALELGTAQLYLMNHTLSSLDDIIARGAMTAAEREGVIQAARIVLLMLH
jgi:hypothetical protein